MSDVLIRDVKTIITCPDYCNLVIVKVETSEPGLYGWGCATFTQRALSVAETVDKYIKPLVTGRSIDNIQDLHKMITVNSYWRSGPVLNNALSGLDMALWDIKGKIAGMPVYQLLGGRCRSGIRVYRHADGKTPKEVAENVVKFMEQGYTHVRCQFGGYGGTAKTPGEKQWTPGLYFDPEVYYRDTIKVFETVRTELGFDVELLHDTHEKIPPIRAVALAKELEQYKLFFLEDCLPPEHYEYLAMIRNQCATPIALGELYIDMCQWLPAVQNRLIDFIRVHMSCIGGITPAVKMAAICEAYGVRLAFHGPGDLSPIGMAANIHVGLASNNFGIQEFSGFSENRRKVFLNCPAVKDGILHIDETPGLGIEVDEEAAAKFPHREEVTEWTQSRWPDGTISYP